MKDSDNPRDGRGRFFTRRCPDPRCDGQLRREDGELRFRTWRCSGLVARVDGGPLVACVVWHQDGGDRP